MKKTIIVIIVILAVAAIACLIFNQGASGDYKRAKYTLDGEKLSLRQNNVKHLGDELRGDFDQSGTEDVAFLISYETSTTTLYYLLAALKTDDGYQGTNARLIGNQIEPINLELVKGHIVVNYADRRPDEPITAEPRFWYKKTFGVRNGQLVRAISI